MAVCRPSTSQSSFVLWDGLNESVANFGYKAIGTGGYSGQERHQIARRTRGPGWSITLDMPPIVLNAIPDFECRKKHRPFGEVVIQIILMSSEMDAEMQTKAGEAIASFCTRRR